MEAVDDGADGAQLDVILQEWVHEEDLGKRRVGQPGCLDHNCNANTRAFDEKAVRNNGNRADLRRSCRVDA